MYVIHSFCFHILKFCIISYNYSNVNILCQQIRIKKKTAPIPSFSRDKTKKINKGKWMDNLISGGLKNLSNLVV